MTTNKRDNVIYESSGCINYSEDNGRTWKPLNYRATANVRFRWLRVILTQISKLTSYIRKRCMTFQV